MKKRVVVTGMGAVTPLGNDAKTTWENIKQGKCGIDFIKSFNTEKYKVKVAAELKGFNPENYMERKEARRMDKFSQYAIAAAQEAVNDSMISLDKINHERFGVIIGSGIGGMQTIEHEDGVLREKGPGRISPFYIPMAIINMAAGNVAIRFKAMGICETVVTACATGTNAIGNAVRAIERGDADIMIAGSTEAAITPLSLAGFTNLTALSDSNDPNNASLPFDKRRNGFVMGEGAGILILEDYEHAVKRGAKIYAEAAGYGTTCDAYHITSPSPDGNGAARAMELALLDAGIKYSDISYINAHGTGTLYNDKFETIAIKKVFKDYAYKIPVSSTKSMIGHLLGAAGAVEAFVSVMSIYDSFIPATIGYSEKDEECDLDYVPNEGRNCEVNYAMSDSLGFGGHNAVIIFKKFV